MRKGTSRDGRQQSRLVQGIKDGFEIYTVDHQKDGATRLDAIVTYRGESNEDGVFSHADEGKPGDKFFRVYTPSAGDDYPLAVGPDDAYIPYNGDGECYIQYGEPITKDSKAWWKLAGGRVLGMFNGNLIEYDRSTLAPLGLVVGADELIGKRIAVLDSGIEEFCETSEEKGMEGADCVGVEPEQAVVIYDDDGKTTVIQPNEDGTYWRKIVRNKMQRMREQRRIKAAKEFAKNALGVKDEDLPKAVVSSWGPYTSTVGTAKKTGVPGLTTEATKSR